jgi:tetratricopeptide (TPR) repeat protein
MGEAFMNSAGQNASERFEADRIDIDIAFRWAAKTASPSNLEAARICVEFVTKASLWPLNLWLPASDRYEWLKQARVAAGYVIDTAASAGILNNIGITELDLGQPRAALESHKEARRLAMRYGHDLEAAHASSSMGICYRHLGQRRKALRAHRAALKLSEAGGFDHLCLNCHGNIAIILSELGDTAAAISGFETTLDFARRLKRRREEGYALGNLVRAYAQIGDLKRAIELHGQDLEIARDLKNEKGIANALGELGNVFVEMGEVSRGLGYHVEQLELAERLSQPREIAVALGNLANSLIYNRRANEASVHLERAFSLYREIGNAVGEFELNQRIAKSYGQLILLRLRNIMLRALSRSLKSTSSRPRAN